MLKPTEYLEKNLSERQKIKLYNLYNNFRAIGLGFNLTRLAKIYSTDKHGTHFYTPHYQAHFKKFKYKRIKLLEIGVGGYENPFRGGRSLRMWKKYFPFGQITSLDIYDKSPLMESRIRIYQGSQTDQTLLETIHEKSGPFDIVIDDGSHINEHVILTFEILFPLLKDGGIYVIEDTQTAYWESYGGDSHDLRNQKTLMNFFKNLTDGLNHEEFIIPGYQKTYYDRKIISMHFYHNLIFIYKGDNDEKSNIVIDNEFPENKENG